MNLIRASHILHSPTFCKELTSTEDHFERPVMVSGVALRLPQG